MNKGLTEEQWQEIDQMIYTNKFLPALRQYQSGTGGSLNAAMDAIHERRRALLLQFPQKFTNEAQYRAEAMKNLQEIQSQIAALEIIKDGDDWCGYVQIFALTEEPSSRHPKYTRRLLCFMRCIGITREKALALGEELALLTQVPLYYAEFSYGDYQTSRYGAMFGSHKEVIQWLSHWTT